DLDAELDRLPGDLITERIDDDTVAFEAPDGLGLALVREPDAQVEYDINHVVLRVPDPARVREDLSTLGFESRDGNLAIAEKELRIDVGDRGGEERPLLNHIAVLVDSAQAVNDEAESRGLEIADFVDAENTVAVFVW